jgi:coiled-coil and C2 domain-containing protein 2A
MPMLRQSSTVCTWPLLIWLDPQILMARERGVTFGGPSWPQCAIPLLDSEVEEGVLWDEFFDKVYAADIPPDEVEDVPVDKQRKKKIIRFQSKVQEQFRKARAKQAGGIKRKYKLRDVVHQPELPELRPFAIMEALRHLFRKRATLRPEQKKNRVAERMPSQCIIRITVQRAYNLPQRRPDSSSPKAPSQQDPAGPGSEANILECMVQARFQNKEATTPIFKGSSPAWNAPLILPFQPPENDWTPGKLLKVTDNLHLNVFDTKVWEISDGQASSRKVEKRWLGNIKIPFTTILNSPLCRIDGIFELDSAALSIGYTSHTSGNTAKPGKRGVSAKIQETVASSIPKSSSILVCIALDPPLQQPGVGTVEIAGRLDDPLLDQCVCTWISSCKAHVHCRSRTYDALARCLKRDWVLITRYIQPCTPPHDAYNTDLSIEVQMLQLCRFVSLIPFLEDWNIDDEGTDDEIPSIWFTSKEFVVDVGAGDWEEHATLLCNFFLHLGKQAYLVFGSGTYPI